MINAWMVDIAFKYYTLHFRFDKMSDAVNMVSFMAKSYAGYQDSDGTEKTELVDYMIRPIMNTNTNVEGDN